VNRDSLLAQFDLTDRVAVITGGSRGIGRAAAEGFAAMGAKVVVASRKADACEEAVRAIESAGGAALAVPTHVGDVDQVAALAEAAASHFGGIDIVINNAANPLALPIGTVTAEALDKSYQANVRGPLFLVQAALPHLRESEHPAVVNVVTAGIYTSGAFVSLYVAAKSALMSLTRSMAAELSRYGIRVNALAPGTVDTDMVRNMPEAFQQSAVDVQLIRRMARPDEMVPALLYLASDASSFMTGQALVVDGGMTVH